MRDHDGGGRVPSQRERMIFQYVEALDMGDMDRVAAVLGAAVDDSELGRLISEVNLAYQEEKGLTPTASDAKLVRDLLHKHFGSAFEDPQVETVPFEVRHVADRLERDPRVPLADREANSFLRSVRVKLPRRLDRWEMERLKNDLNVEASQRYWRQFRDAAIMMEIGRANSLGRLAAREENARRGGRKEHSASHKKPHEERRAVELVASDDGSGGEVAALIDTVYQDAGIEGPGAGIAPLYDLIGAYPLSVREVKGLTYESAAKELSSLTGQRISFLDERQHDRKLAGFLYTQGDFGCILVKGDDAIGRRRFSAAHELGHYVRHFLPLLKRQDQGVLRESLILVEGLSYPEDEESADEMPAGLPKLTHAAVDLSLAGDVEQIELEANEFAAELLMPAPVCKELVEGYRQRYGRKLSVLSRLLATELLVSQGAMKRRLRELELVGE
jgi:DNA-binding phage protein